MLKLQDLYHETGTPDGCFTVEIDDLDITRKSHVIFLKM
jgi:hypothetical protein